MKTATTTLMDFNSFQNDFYNHFTSLSSQRLYLTDVDRQSLWDTYLESFSVEERQTHNCNCCRSFIKNYGNLVTIDSDFNLHSIWDFTTSDSRWQKVIDSMRDLVCMTQIRDVFVTNTPDLGIQSSIQVIKDNEGKLLDTQKWFHLYLNVPRNLLSTRKAQDYRDPRNVFKRALDEFNTQTIEVALDLVDQGLYKGIEYKSALESLLQEQRLITATAFTPQQLDNYFWVAAERVGIAIAKIRNSPIGTLLIDISKNVDLDISVKKFENMVAPQNYRRTTALSSQRQIQEAENFVIENGLLDSLPRRFAVVDDITANDILWLNRNTTKVKSAFELLKAETPINPKKLESRIDEVSIEDFLNKIIPRSTKLEIFLENRHTNNLFSLIAPTVAGCKPLTRWVNNFSWYYTGDVTDSIIKQNVEKAGGNVNAVLRFSIQWNEKGNNNIDFDAHATIASNNRGGISEHIYFGSFRGTKSPAHGQLDVDIVSPCGKVAVENICYTSLDKLPESTYHFYVNNYSSRISNGGFSAEIEFGGVTYSYSYSANLKPKQNITVAKFKFTKANGIEFIESLDSSSSVQSKEVWGLHTNTWQPVSMAMLSPNYWHSGDNTGNKHFFFVLEKAINDDPVVRGFYNEFLIPSLHAHRKTFEMLGRKMLVEPSEYQLSGLGFSSTLRNDFLVRVTGASQRILKVRV